MKKTVVRKKIKSTIRLEIPGGGANPSPPVGPALGQQGANIMEFCNAFNTKTKVPETQGKPLPVIVTVYEDRSFVFVVHAPIASYLIMEAAGIKQGSSTPGKGVKVGRITRQQLREIAKVKISDLTAINIEAAVRCLAGTARSMGVEVEGE